MPIVPSRVTPPTVLRRECGALPLVDAAFVDTPNLACRFMTHRQQA